MDQKKGESLSGYSQLIDYRLQRGDKGYAEVTLTIGAQHLNRLGVLHGGVLATLIDTATGYAVACLASFPLWNVHAARYCTATQRLVSQIHQVLSHPRSTASSTA